MNSILNENSIWDLHIHTNLCPKGSREFSKMNTKDYVNNLLKQFESYKDLSMISFTDHNQISYEVYREFKTRDSSIVLLPGIEIDVMIADDPDFKHIIFYFDLEVDDDFEEFSNQLNLFVSNKAVDIFELLNFLISKKINFVISPHSFKQGKRAVNYSWCDESKVDENAHKFMDQFYCFWEAGGYSEISRAVGFLKDFLIEERVSIVAFSDSASSKELNDYLSNPPQYFKSLPSFKGLQMVATDCSRISEIKIKTKVNNKGNLIGRIVFNNEEIALSDSLNAIIGGRGSGKSLLLDALCCKILDNDRINSDRKDYIKEFPLQLYNFNGGEIKKGNFQIDYYEQSYVSKIFNNGNYSEEIKKYFSDAFDEIDDIDCSSILAELKNDYKEQLEKYNELSKENISSLIEKYIQETDVKLKLPLTKNAQVKIKVLETLNYEEQIKALTSSKIMPSVLKENPKILKAVNELQIAIAQESYEYNLKNYDDFLLKNELIDNYALYKKTISETSAEKQKVEQQFLNNINIKELNYKKRVNIVNSILKICQGFEGHIEQPLYMDGMESKAFLFKKEFDIENPLAFLIRKLDEYYSSTKLSYRVNLSNVEKIVNEYCYSSNGDKIKDSKNIAQLDEELTNFALKTDESFNIYFKDIDSNYVNIRDYSPGTQTNILMEFIVNKDTDIPLLIDQPEDNIDNYTIYCKLKKWFVDLKSKRQIIVVTHDANIAINADSENLIIAEQIKSNEFKYKYGALEYENNLEVASNVLDGGKDAVKRRMLKYGE